MAGGGPHRDRRDRLTAASPDDRKLLRLEVRFAETPIERKPEWIRTRARIGPDDTALQCGATAATMPS